MKEILHLFRAILKNRIESANADLKTMKKHKIIDKTASLAQFEK